MEPIPSEPTEALDRRHRVALVVMPFAAGLRPSHAMSQLKSCLGEQDIDADILYLNLRFADTLGPSLYHQIAIGQPSHADLLGEWIFASFDHSSESSIQEYIDTCLLRETTDRRSRPSKEFIDAAVEAKRLAPEFIDRCVAEVPWEDYAAAVFVAPFLEQQLNGALRLAEGLRRSHPRLETILGGTAVEGEVILGILRTNESLSIGLSGEWDRVLPLYLSDRARAAGARKYPGLIHGDSVRQMTDSAFAKACKSPSVAPGVRDLDALPIPDYTDYLEAYHHSSFKSVRRKPSMLMETSRGCWWGEKHHCTFCGLNQENMGYRAKSARRALAELVELEGRHGEEFGTLAMTDTIMPMSYLKEFFSDLPPSRNREFYYETKSNLRPSDVKTLADAGATIIQPGIESFSSAVLDRMRKGVTAIQNVQFLKSARQHSVQLIYNLLLGQPGGKQDEIDDMVELLPSLYHLQPPGWWGQIHLDRYSPMYTQSDEFGVTVVGPAPAYKFVLPGLRELDTLKVATFFAYREDGPALQTDQLIRVVREWSIRAERGASLLYSDQLVPGADGDIGLKICDRRDPERPLYYLLLGDYARLLLKAGEITSTSRLARELSLPLAAVDEIVDLLSDIRLILRLDGRVLSLPLAGESERRTQDEPSDQNARVIGEPSMRNNEAIRAVKSSEVA